MKKKLRLEITVTFDANFSEEDLLDVFEEWDEDSLMYQISKEMMVDYCKKTTLKLIENNKVINKKELMN